jgi:hypothetical protein
LSYSVGFTLPDMILDELALVPAAMIARKSPSV